MLNGRFIYELIAVLYFPVSELFFSIGGLTIVQSSALVSISASIKCIVGNEPSEPQTLTDNLNKKAAARALKSIDLLSGGY